MAPAGGGSGLRCGSLPGGDEEGPGRGGSPASPFGAASLRPGRRLPRLERARAGDPARPAGLGWGRRRQGPPPLTGSRRRCRLGGSECPLPQPEGGR